MRKLETKEGIELVLEIQKCIDENIKKTVDGFVNLVESIRNNDVPEEFLKILKKYGINSINSSDLEGKSLCKNGILKPEDILSQILYASLHPKLKGKDLWLDYINDNNINNEGKIQKIFLLAMKKVGIKTENFDYEKINKMIKIIEEIGLEEYTFIHKDKESEKHLFNNSLNYDDDLLNVKKLLSKKLGKEVLKYIGQNNNLSILLCNIPLIEKLVNKMNGLNLLKYIGNNNSLSDFFYSDENILKLFKILKNKKIFESMKYIGNYGGLYSIINDDEKFEILNKIVSNKIGMNILEIIGDKEISLSVNLGKILELSKNKNIIEILEHFKDNYRLKEFLKGNIIGEYKKVGKKLGNTNINF